MQLIEQSQNHMNTTFFLTVSIHDTLVSFADQQLLDCHRVLTKLENILSEFKIDSDVSRLNRSEPKEKTKVSPHVISILETSLKVSQWSLNEFNPAFRSQNLLSFEQNFDWDLNTAVAWRNEPTSKLGFGAIGKGYALDVIHHELMAAGLNNHRLIAGGSSIIFSGQENKNQPWKISFGFKKVGTEILGFDLACLNVPIYLGISGELNQGQHIVNQNKLHSSALLVGVTSRTAAAADAISTAIFANPELRENSVDDGFILIDNEERLFTNKVFKNQFG